MKTFKFGHGLVNHKGRLNLKGNQGLNILLVYIDEKIKDSTQCPVQQFLYRIYVQMVLITNLNIAGELAVMGC